jgi:hypothetical protein
MQIPFSAIDRYEPKPLYAQIAVGGNWEDAIRIDLENPQLPAKDIDSSVAGEVFYALSDGRRAFLGLRYAKSLHLATTPEAFLRDFLTVLQGASQRPFQDTVKLLGTALDGNPQTYAEQALNKLELGVVDFWKSAGSLVIWNEGQSLPDEQAISKKLVGHQPLITNQKNHIALELAGDNPEFWLGVQVSTKQTDTYQLNQTLLQELISAL